MEEKLHQSGIPAKEIKVFGSQIMITAWSKDAARKWASLLSNFAKVRGIVKTTDLAKEQKGTVLRPTRVTVWRVGAYIPQENPGGVEVELTKHHHFLPFSTKKAAQTMARLLCAEGVKATVKKIGGEWGVDHTHANPFYGEDLDLETSMAPAWMYYDSKEARDQAARLYEGRGQKIVKEHSLFGYRQAGGKRWRLRAATHMGNPFKPTIYEALVSKLGRIPTNAELKAEVERIKREAYEEAATKGKLRHQRKNPDGAAEEMFESFHGEPSDETLEYVEEEHYHSHVSALGELVELKVKLVSGDKAVIGFDAGSGEEQSNPFWPFNSFTKTTIYHVGTGEKYKKSGSFKGYTLYQKIDTGEFLVPALDKESRFDTLKDAREFVNSWTKHQKNPKRRRGTTGPFHEAGKLVGGITHGATRPVDEFLGTAGKVGGYLDSQIGRALNPEREYKTEASFKKALAKATTDGTLVHWYGTDHGWVVVTKKLAKTNPDHSDTGPAYLTTNEAGTQLFIVGGDQSLDLAGLGITGDEAEKEMVYIGHVTHVTYHTTKIFDGKTEEFDYQHRMGESGGEEPILNYDRINKQLILSGGTYRIEKPLFGTSPGIER